MYFHIEFPYFILAAGAFGVELFFVLSGFLIGGILAELTATRPTLREWAIFMVRRWMRTLPLYFVWIVVTMLVTGPPRNVSIWRYVFLMQNFAWPMPEENWFAVSWSLTIEEWFYLLFSASLFLATAVTGARRAIWLMAGAFLIVSFVVRYIEVDTIKFMETTYKTMLLHLDAISYGVVAALLHRRKSAIFDFPYLCLAVGVVIVVTCWAQFSATIALPIEFKTFLRWFSVLTSFGYALCLPALLRLRSLPPMLSVPIRHLSTYSYALYIIHLSVIDYFNWWIVGFGLNPVLGIMAATVITFALAFLSWRYFERPILKARPDQFQPARDKLRLAIPSGRSFTAG